jgi:DHA2 family multidrug resistance protein
MTLRGSKAGITAAAMCAALMAVLDISIVNVAVSDIRASFATPLDQIGWISTGYMTANVVVIPLTGWLQRRFGYRAYFTSSIVLFTIASAFCGVAWNLPALVVFRVMQGVGGGAIIPTAQAILFDRYPKEEHSFAGALFGIGALTAPLLGPTVGGYLIEWASWRWIFYVNVPLGTLAAVLSWIHLRDGGESRQVAREPVDVWGIALLAAGMGALQYVLEEGNRDGWFESRLIVVLSVVAGVALITFVVHELEAPHPVVDLRVFANRSYSAATALNFLVGTCVFSGTYLFSLYCGAIMHYSARDIGLVFLVSGGVQLVVVPIVGVVGGKVDGRPLVAAGIAITALGMWLDGHLTDSFGYWDLVRPRIVMVVGLGLLFVPLSVLALSDLPESRRGNASGLFNLTRELGGSIGTALIGTLLDRRGALYSSHLFERVSLFDPLARGELGFARRVLQSDGGVALVFDARVRVQALVRAFNDGFLYIAVGFAAGLALTLLLKRNRPGEAIEIGH